MHNQLTTQTLIVYAYHSLSVYKNQFSVAVMQDDGFIAVKSRHRTNKKSISNQYRTKSAVKQGQRDVDLNQDIIIK